MTKVRVEPVQIVHAGSPEKDCPTEYGVYLTALVIDRRFTSRKEAQRAAIDLEYAIEAAIWKHVDV